MTALKNVFEAPSLEEFSSFPASSFQLGIFNRQEPSDADRFFKLLMKLPFSIAGTVSKESAEEDIYDMLADDIPQDLQNDPFYKEWVTDMAQVCVSFCHIQKEEAVGFWLGSQRGCRRYHIDNVPLRALVTYAGKGTEWLPDEAADRKAYAEGAPNEAIIKDASAIRFMQAWDVAVFKGGAKGLLHRTPDDAIEGPSIMMRLDHPSFWNNILRNRRMHHS